MGEAPSRAGRARQSKAVGRRYRGGTSGAGPVRERTPKPSASLWARFRYRLDNALSRGAWVVIGYLGLVTLAIVLLAAVITVIAHLIGFGGGGQRLGVLESFWQMLVRVVDAGSFASDATWPTRLLALLVTLAGIFIAGSLIGLISSAVDQRVDAVRRRSHHRRRAGRRERERAAVGHRDPGRPRQDLDGGDPPGGRGRPPHHAAGRPPGRPLEHDGPPAGQRAEGPVDPGDERRGRGRRGHQVLPRGAGAGPDRHPDHRGDGIRVAGRHAGGRDRQRGGDGDLGPGDRRGHRPGLPRAGPVHGVPGAARLRWRRAVLPGVPGAARRHLRAGPAGLRRAAVMGIAKGEGVELNPPPDRVLEQGDRVIALVEDDSKFLCTGVAPLPEVVPGDEPDPELPQHILFMGWSSLAPRVIRELDEFLPLGSRLTVLVDPGLVDPSAVAHELAREDLGLVNSTATVRALPGGPELLGEILGDEPYDQGILLGYREGISAGDADARTLLTLMALRQRWPKGHPPEVRLVAEVLDQRNVPIAQLAGVDDFIVSDQLASLMLAQLSENVQFREVFDELFDAEGASIVLRPAKRFAQNGSATFAEIVAAGNHFGESVLGYRSHRDGRVVLNPEKGARIDLAPEDEVVVVTTR